MDHVIACTAEQRVVCTVSTIQRVVAIAADQQQSYNAPAPPTHRLVPATPANHLVRAGPRTEHTTATTAEEPVKRPDPPIQHVAAITAFQQLMLAGARHERIGTIAAVE